MVEGLSDFAAATVAAADATGVKYLDLNGASTDYINAIGQEDSIKYDRTEGDVTHLNRAGEKVFGRMTLDLLLEKRGDLAEFFEDNKALSAKIKDGEFA